MKLSAPIYILKQQAKVLSRKEKIPLHQALDRIATREGFKAWSQLSSVVSAANSPTATLWSQLSPGDLVLLGARPNQGKTLLSLSLAIESMKQGGRAAFFTLDFTRRDVAECFTVLDQDLKSFDDKFLIDDSDRISADYIVARLESAPPNMLVVIDYLQLLDQQRAKPGLADQMQQLKRFARERKLIIVCLSQIDRSYDAAQKPYPEFSDVRLPNPLDLQLFDRACFLNQGKMKVESFA